MKVFIDLEFTGLHQHTTLISIGLVSENNQKLYCELTDYDETQIDTWIENNVINKLGFWDTDDVQFRRGYQTKIRREVEQWLLSQHHISGKKIEIWADCLAYDWVLFCELFGGAKKLPEFIYYIPFDLATLFKIKGIDPDINREVIVARNEDEEFYSWLENPIKHNALWDAQIIKECYDKLM